MSGEVKIKDFSNAEKMIKKNFLNFKKLDESLERTDGDKGMQRKIESKKKLQEKDLKETLRGTITFLQTNYPKTINHLLKKKKYITSSKSSLTKFENELIKSDAEEILETFLDIFDLDESSPVKFKNDEDGKELNKIMLSLKKLNLDDLLDLMLDDDEDDKDSEKNDKKETKSKKTNNSTKSLLSEVNETIERILKISKLSPEKKSEKLKKVIVIAKKSLGTSPKSKKISPLLDSINKKLDSISDDSALTKIVKILQKLLSKV